MNEQMDKWINSGFSLERGASALSKCVYVYAYFSRSNEWTETHQCWLHNPRWTSWSETWQSELKGQMKKGNKMPDLIHICTFFYTLNHSVHEIQSCVLLNFLYSEWKPTHLCSLLTHITHSLLTCVTGIFLLCEESFWFWKLLLQWYSRKSSTNRLKVWSQRIIHQFSESGVAKRQASPYAD